MCGHRFEAAGGRSAGHLVREAVARRKALTVLENCEVTSLNRAGNRLDSVTVRNRESDQVSRYRATRYVLAAGAIGSACILMRSGFEHRQLGRNYMMHYSPLVVGIFATATEADTRFVKQVGFGDFYFGTADMPAKMGLVQSLPAPGPLMLKKAGMQRLPNLLLTQLRRRMLPFVGIVEDLPDPQNLVQLSANGHIHLRHRFSDYDRRRGTAMSKAMCRLLRTAGAMYCVSRKLPSEEHVAHQCGTIRFGTDPEHAVVDRNGRMFEQEDLFVVDGSILPTSLGVGPSLTLMANALRVADILKAEF
ncbi:MAG: GMC oxidoreductase [Fuerstiella sp.]